MQISDYELLGQVIDGIANNKTRQKTILNMTNPMFREYFMLALKATKLFDDKIDAYETVR